MHCEILKFVSIPLCPGHSKNAQFASSMNEDSGHYAGCAERSCQKCLTLQLAHLQVASDCGRRSPTLGQYCRVVEIRTAEQVAFTLDRAL